MLSFVKGKSVFFRIFLRFFVFYMSLTLAILAILKMVFKNGLPGCLVIAFLSVPNVIGYVFLSLIRGQI